MDLIKDIYEKGDKKYQPKIVACSEEIDQKMIDKINGEILPKLTIRPDRNGQPQLYKTPKGRLFLRTHPYYCFEGNHYGRIYEYHLIENDQISSKFYMYIYDTIAIMIDEVNIDFIFDKLLMINNKQRILFEETTKIGYEDGRFELETYYIEPSEFANIDQYKVDMKSGKVPKNQYGFIVNNDQTYGIMSKGTENEKATIDSFFIPKAIDNFDHELWDNLNKIRYINPMTEMTYWIVAGYPRFVKDISSIENLSPSKNNLLENLKILSQQGKILERNFSKIEKEILNFKF